MLVHTWCHIFMDVLFLQILPLGECMCAKVERSDQFEGLTMRFWHGVQRRGRSGRRRGLQLSIASCPSSGISESVQHQLLAHAQRNCLAYLLICERITLGLSVLGGLWWYGCILLDASGINRKLSYQNLHLPEVPNGD